MSRDRGRDLQIADRLEDPFVRRSLKTALHLRRYLPFYVFGMFWIITLSIFPSIGSRDGGGSDFLSSGDLPAGEALEPTGDDAVATGDAGTLDNGGAGGGTGVSVGGSGGGASTGAATAPTGKAAGGGAAASGAAAAPAGAVTAAPQSVQESIAFAQRKGKMRDGRECNGQIRQVPNARYGAICTAAYSGPNGGATYHGVTGEKIRIVRREFPESANSRAVDQFGSAAGLADEATTKRVRDEFIAKFDQIFELYGRKIEWVDYESQNGNSTDEALGKGREGACADATYIKETLKAFAVLDASAVFGECAAQRGMMVFSTGAYYPESWYKKYHPYLWGGVMECERVSYQNAEYIGKRLLPFKTTWAGDPTMNGKPRKFGIYVPDNDEYQHCVRISNRIVKEKYGGPNPESYNYQLDVSRFPDQAAQGMLQFKAAGVTTVVLACDPISTVALTQAASKQAYYPEWYMIGTALNDVDALARLFDQTQADGHLWGMSQLGATDKLLGRSSESGVVYKTLMGKEIPEGTTGDYYATIGAYSRIQAAGPIVHPQTLAEGIWAQPPAGAPDYPVGYVSYQDGSDGTPGARDHTGIDDSREVWWCYSACKGPDGEQGTYVETYGGKRFRNGEWPAESPPVFKK